MARVLVGGMAVVDFVFQLPTMPNTPEKYRAEDAAIVGGGIAANAAVAISRLGGEAVLAARLGKDSVGDMILQDLSDEGVETAQCHRAAGGRSSFSSVFVDGHGERQIVNFRGSGLVESTDWLAAIPGGFGAILADTRWPAGAAALMRRAQDLGVPGIIDAEAPVPEEALAEATHVAFSRQGLTDLTGETDLGHALSAARMRFDAWLAVTDGAAGVRVLDAEGERFFPAPKVKPVDTLAAGDVWHGAFALALAEGQGEDAAIRFASAAASLKCTRFGGRAGTPTREELIRFMAKDTP